MTGFFAQGSLADGGIYTPTENCSIKIACTSGTLTISETINGVYSANGTTIPNGQYLVLENVFQGQSIKVTGGTANYQAFRNEK